MILPITIANLYGHFKAKVLTRHIVMETENLAQTSSSGEPEAIEDWSTLNDTFPLPENDPDNPMQHTTVRIALIVLYSIVFVLCFVGNLTVIAVIALHYRMRTVTNFFLANLAATDLCVGIFCVLPNLSIYLSPYWILGRTMCKLHYFIQAMSYTASITILTVISVERYVAIIHPMRSRQFQTMCLLRTTILVVWIASACSGIPNLVVYDTVELPTPDGSTVAFCILSIPLNDRVYAVAIFVLWYLVPLVLITFVYSRISFVLWRSSGWNDQMLGGSAVFALTARNYTDVRDPSRLDGRSKAAGESGFSGLLRRNNPDGSGGVGAVGNCRQKTRNSVTWESGTVAGTSTRLRHHRGSNTSRLSREELFSTGPIRRESYLRKAASAGSLRAAVGLSQQRSTKTGALFSRRKVVRLLLAIVATFSLCVLPYHVRVLWLAFGKPDPGYWQMLVPPLTFVMYYANSGLNPLLYAFLSEKFRASLTDLVRCSESNQLRRFSLTVKTLNTVA